MPRARHALDELAATLPGGGVAVRATVAQLEGLLAPGETGLVLATGTLEGEFGVLALTSQRAVFVEWTNERRQQGRVVELPRGALRLRVADDRVELAAPRGSFTVESVQPPAALRSLREAVPPSGRL